MTTCIVNLKNGQLEYCNVLCCLAVEYTVILCSESPAPDVYNRDASHDYNIVILYNCLAVEYTVSLCSESPAPDVYNRDASHDYNIVMCCIA